MLKRTSYLLLLLLAASCGSRQQVQHVSPRVDVQPLAPVTVPMPVVTVVEEEPEAAEPVVSAQPLVSQVHRAPEGSWQCEKQRALDSLCLSPIFETTQVGIYVYDLTEGQPLYAVNAAQRMRPASCQKVVTAVTALHCLKSDFCLRTEFRTTGNVVNGSLQGNLIVVGGMDPLVTPDELLQAAAAIKSQQGIQTIAGKVIYDCSMREDAPYGWGWCWDDDYGPLSALMVDGKDGFELKWQEAMVKAGIKVQDPPQPSPKGREQKGTVVYSIRHDLDELLFPMMKESNNIYAECLFYQTAATSGKKGAGRKETAMRTDNLLKSIGLNPDEYKVADGSGLSLYNYVSAEMLVALLGYAWQTPRIKEHLLPSLPIAGYDGTLQKRMIGTPAEGNVQAKTGTVTGISSLAGYINAANGHTLAFAIINQGVSSAAIGRTFQDKVCIELAK